MTLTPARAEAIRRLDAIVTGLNTQVWQLTQLRSFLMGDETRVPAAYDLPPDDAEAVAERFGLPSRDDAPGEPPEWYTAMMSRIADEDRPETPPPA